jgi:hypothetical protein
MSDDADSATGRRDFHYCRWKLTKFAAGSFGFAALGAFLIYWSAATAYAAPGVLGILSALPTAAIGLVTVAFFGMILITAIGAFLDRAPVVTVTAESIHDRRWGGTPVPWSEVREITGILVDRRDGLIAAGNIAIVVDHPSRYYRPRSLYARFTYGSMRNPLFFNMVALDGTDMDLATGLLARVPDRIPRSTVIWPPDQDRGAQGNRRDP